ncbi:MAG: hypothetical protein NTV49_03830 [Kiritimatiellaeota bacterium]|nr:hypothetical protein [Kiritimatiellota bacterium]
MKAKSEGFVPNALREVWAWKEAVYRETEGLGMSETLVHMHREAEAVRKKFGFKVVSPLVDVARVAEERNAYGEPTEKR